MISRIRSNVMNGLHERISVINSYKISQIESVFELKDMKSVKK